MAGIGNKYVDLIDIEKQKNPDGSMADVIEMLMELNPMLEDAMAVECNDGTSHRTTIRTGLPSVSWGKLYAGVQQGKSKKAQVTDTTGFVEGASSIDCRLLDISSNQGAVRLSEAKGYLESIAQEVQTTMIYGNSASAPEEFMGLAPRFNDLSASNGKQIIDAGGTGSDNTSIWIVTWDDDTCHTLYPQGSVAGVKREDMGKQRVTDEDGNPYYVLEEMFTQSIGLTVKDWRYVTRIANIDVSAMKAGTVPIYDHLRSAYYKNEGRRRPKGRTVIYMNTDVMEVLDTLATNAGSTDNFIRLKTTEVEGREVTSYRGMPIRETDALMNTEARVVAS